MIDEKLLQQYYDLLGAEGVGEMYETFADNIGGYLELMQHLVAQRDETETRRQAHKLKGACRSVGLHELASEMELIERQPWQWEELEKRLDAWAKQQPQHQAELKRWLVARGVQ